MLRSLNFSEIEKISDQLNLWSGFQVQMITGSDQVLGIKLYGRGQNHHLWIDLNAKAPVVIDAGASFPPHKKRMKPVHLFAHSHLNGMKLVRTRVEPQKGRVLFLLFENEDSEFLLEVRLFPPGRNILMSCGGKKIHWTKPQELSSGAQQTSFDHVRSWEEISKAYLEQSRAPKKSQDSALKDWQKKLGNDLKKKNRALDKLNELIVSEEGLIWSATGQWLQSFGSSEFPKNIPSEWAERIQVDQSLAWNIQNCFEKSKKMQGKSSGRREQQQKLQDEIDEIEKKLERPSLFFSKKNPPVTRSLLEVADARGRQKKIEEGVTAIVGKTGKDNLDLLRRAKPWYLWLHLKDEPSAHLIITLNKGKKLSGKSIEMAASWLIEQNYGVHHKDHVGRLFAIIVVECRYVRPIKGDRLGRVTHQNEKNHQFIYQGPQSGASMS